MNQVLYFGKDKMEIYLPAIGYDVWDSVVYGNTPTDESRKYNSKSMNIILSSLPDSMKSNVC